MQRARKVLSRLWAYLLLLYSGLILIFLTLRTQPPLLLIMPSYIFTPGYALVAVFFPKLRKLEKVVMSLAFSIGLIVGIKSFMQTFATTELFSELALVTVFSAVCFIVELIK